MYESISVKQIYSLLSECPQCQGKYFPTVFMAGKFFIRLVLQYVSLDIIRKNRHWT